MARRSPKASSAETIQKLLDDRQTLGGWLERLEKAGDDTPEDVRQRVRDDYARRLESVGKRLRGFRSELQDTLQEKTAAHIEMFDRETEAKSRLAEAELRHTVGETDDQEWSPSGIGELL